MNHASKGCLIAAALLAAGCANPTGETPLMFVSTNAFGVDIGSSPTAGQLPALTLGYKSVDAAFVPVTTAARTGSAIRGCYSAARSMDSVGSCADVAEAPKPPAPAPAVAAEARGDTILTLLRTGDVVAEKLAQAVPLAPAKPSAIPVIGAKAAPVGPTASVAPAVLATPIAKSDPFGQSMRDSLSVYSSFNADTHVGTDAGVQLGKAFATGVAAQQLTEGVNYYMQYKGQALLPSSEAGKETALRTECMSALVTAKDKQVPDALLPSCNEKSIDDLKFRTACVQVLASAVEKKVPQDKLPKCG